MAPGHAGFRGHHVYSMAQGYDHGYDYAGEQSWRLMKGREGDCLFSFFHSRALCWRAGDGDVFFVVVLFQLLAIFIVWKALFSLSQVITVSFISCS